MSDAVLDRLSASDVVIGAAAPADYAPAAPAARKIKKGTQSLSVELEPTPDILAECGRRKRSGQLLVGFAAETENLLANARSKLRAKKLDMIVANDVSAAGVGFDADENAGKLLLAGGQAVDLPRTSKAAFAERVLDAVAEALRPAPRRPTRRKPKR
jgi:phosphopantothenoylcysteine decarboxylase/phosphopantothenate--cysteine ligase